MNDASADEATLRTLTSRFDVIQAAADRAVESPQATKQELDSLEQESALSPAEAVTFWTRLAGRTGASAYEASVKYAHVRLVARILAYFGVPFP